MDRAHLLEQLRLLRPWLATQGVSRVALFGSHARDAANSQSDIDLVVEFAPGRTPDLFAFAGLKLELEQRLGAPVDLFTPDSLHPGLRGRIEAALIDAWQDWRILVADMIEYARHARAHAVGMDEAVFHKELKTIHAVTRCVEIIGEAARAVPADVRARAPEVPWAQIVATRNILAHGYGRVDPAILWGLVKSGLQKLEADLAPLLRDKPS